MSGSKFYIWGGGRWREVNTASGEVAGWSRRPRFVFARRGRLRVATKRRVLVALQAHAANLPSAVELGPRLSVLRNEPPPTPTVRALPSVQPVHPMCAHHHCCIYSHGLHNNNFDKCNHNDALITSNCSTKNGTAGLAILKGASLTNGSNAAVQHRATVDAAVQHSASDHHTLSINLEATNFSRLQRPPQTHRCDPKHNTAASGVARSEGSRPRAPPLHNLLGPMKRHRSALSDSDDSEQHFEPASETRRSQNDERSPKRTQKTASKTKRRETGEGRKKRRSESLSDENPEEACKELTISESDVLALRSLVQRTRSDALERFDADDDYKRMLFYAINPLVHVERCPLTERALRERHALALPQFAARLGLTPTPTPTGADADKENKRKPERRVLRSNNEKRRTAAHIDGPSELSDSDDELELFQNSRGTKRPNSKNNLRKNIRDLVSLRDSYKYKRLVISDDGKGDKNRHSPRLATHTNSGRAASFKKSEILRQKDENELELNYKSNIDKFGTPIESRRENASEDNKRRSLRRSTLIQSNRVEDDAGSDEKRETLKNGETSRSASPAPKPNKRESLPRDLVGTPSDTTDSSDSGDTVEERESSRTKRVTRRRPDSDSDEERETVVDSGRGSEPSEERRSLRLNSKPEKRDTDSTRKSSRISVSAITKSYTERSASEADSASSLEKSVTQRNYSKISAKHVPNGRTSRAGTATADNEGAAVSEPAKLVKPSVKAAPNKARAPPAPTEVAAEASAAHAHAHIISKRASSGKTKEYSNLEDHAIVAWVSGGARARRVNGNALWRELQDQYPRLTGVSRSWHSLRNRYLRYILPALGALRLPPADVSRLRAAAAAGSQRRRGAAGEGRRNSIFDQSEVSAASARVVRPLLARSPTPTPTHPVSRKHSEGASSPTRRPPARDVTAATRAPGRDAPDAEGAGGAGRGARSTRSRKLFNPKLVL
ncbi:unnamed protein product [Arctia plantaginis]|uniref:TERF2-interacting telomeric protein 1 Myb domain-containing protein n=1 Tax=Arctia plantaginis TaxID=874455 RepID=A0A8S1AVI8_ARCPL|nr:unnamed protein product [Arctia plantaginis]